MITQYKHKTKPNLFHFHKDGTPMSDPSEEIAGMHNWEPLGRVADVPEHLRRHFLSAAIVNTPISRAVWSSLNKFSGYSSASERANVSRPDQLRPDRRFWTITARVPQQPQDWGVAPIMSWTRHWFRATLRLPLAASMGANA